MYAASTAASCPDRPAIIMAATGEVVTYEVYEQEANRAAQLFRQAGLEQRDHVAFLMENSAALLECEGGAERTGLYYTPLDTHLSPDELAYIVKDCHARLVVTSAAMADKARHLPALCPEVERWLITGPVAPGCPFEPYDLAVAGLSTDPVPEERLGTPMLYSSGTTGRPKGIIRRLPDRHPGVESRSGELAQRLFGLHDGAVYLSPAPLYHSAPQSSVSTALRVGATTIVMDRFDAAWFLELVERHQVTHTQVVPTMLSRLLRLPDDVRAAADVSSLRYVVHAAAPCPVPVKEQMIEWFGPIIAEYYSSTEANGVTWCDSAEWLAHKGTVGRPILGDVVILAEDGHECATGETGAIWFRGATNFEYFNHPDQTAASRSVDGDMSTVGDVGYLDSDGYLYLTDRKTMTIICGGVNIYPQESENVLLTHPAVLDAAVIGVPNADLGEEVKAVVQLVEGTAASPVLEDELITFCRRQLAPLKCPRSVDFVDALPRLPTGKLAKRLLREAYWDGRDSLLV